MITEQENRFVLVVLFSDFKLMLRKDLLIGNRPGPFDLFLEAPHVRHVVDAMTDIDAISAFLFRPALLQVHDHGPLLVGQYPRGRGRFRLVKG
jgi:hypothetical protein